MGDTDWMWCFEQPKEAAAELDRLRAEVRSMHVFDNQHRGKIAALEADKAAKDGIIANLNERSAQYERDCAAKDARIAELEARTFLGLTQALAAERARAEKAEDRIAELETKVEEWRVQSSIYEKRAYAAQDPAGALARAEKAEADCKRAEAELKSEHEEFDSLAAILAEWKAIARSAEAERDALREPLAKLVEWWTLLPKGSYSPQQIERWLDKLDLEIIIQARAALNPSPAGRDG